MHLPVLALPGAPSLMLDPAAQAVAAQVFGRRASAAWMPGPVLVTGGDLVVETPGRGLRIAEGTNARMGVSVLVAGTVAVANTSITANTRVFMDGQNLSGTAGELSVSARVAGASFTITSSNVADTRTVAWMLVEPAP
jgi:hypothetical protein